MLQKMKLKPQNSGCCRKVVVNSGWLYILNNPNLILKLQIKTFRRRDWTTRISDWTSRCQFHQHFTCAFFIRKCFSMLRVWLWTNFRTKNLLVKRWWNWRQKSRSKIYSETMINQKRPNKKKVNAHSNNPPSSHV